MLTSHGGWASSHALILAPVAHPAAIRVGSHVAPGCCGWSFRKYKSINLEGCPHKNWVWSSPVLSLPVAVHRADTVTTIPFVDLKGVLMDMCCFGLCWGDFWSSALVGRPGWCSSCRTSNRQSPCQRRNWSQCCYNPRRSKFKSFLTGVFLWPGSKAQSRWRCWCHSQSQKLKTMLK